jgi:LacI family transcriptional regulator, galactose operon repressor
VWLYEYETLDDARRGIGGYADRYHRRPHSRLDYKTPLEVRQTWEDLQNIAAQPVNDGREQVSMAASIVAAEVLRVAGRASARTPSEPLAQAFKVNIGLGNVPRRRGLPRPVAEIGTAHTTKAGKRRDPTILDLARAANVSKTTASRVLNGAPNVAPETRARVFAAIKRIDYRVNVAARSLRTTRSFLVGYLVPAVANDVFGRFAEVLEEELRHDGVGLVIASSGWEEEGERLAIESLRARRVDALVLSLVNDRDPNIGTLLRSISQPIVLIDREVKGVSADVVLTDERSASRDAIEHLSALGHTAVGFATISTSVRPGRESLAGYQKAVDTLGLRSIGEAIVPYGRVDRRSGHEIADQMIEGKATAILCCVPTTVTAGVLERLEHLGVQVPGDVSVIGFDDSDLASVIRPHLSVLARPLEQVSRHASRLITSRLIDPSLPARVEVVHMHLLVRQSTAPPSAPIAETDIVAPGLIEHP